MSVDRGNLGKRGAGRDLMVFGMMHLGFVFHIGHLAQLNPVAKASGP